MKRSNKMAINMWKLQGISSSSCIFLELKCVFMKIYLRGSVPSQEPEPVDAEPVELEPVGAEPVEPEPVGAESVEPEQLEQKKWNQSQWEQNMWNQSQCDQS